MFLQDFLEMLPLKEVTHPAAGPLNLAVHLPDSTLRPDLGPKSYIAYGRCVLTTRLNTYGANDAAASG